MSDVGEQKTFFGSYWSSRNNTHIFLIQSLGYEKIAGEFRGCHDMHENGHEKGFETSPLMKQLALSLEILMAFIGP